MGDSYVFPHYLPHDLASHPRTSYRVARTTQYLLYNLKLYNAKGTGRHQAIYNAQRSLQTCPHAVLVQLPRTMLSERRLQLIDLVGERVDQLLQLGGRLEVVVVHRDLHRVFRLLLPCAQLRQPRGARVVPARRRSLG